MPTATITQQKTAQTTRPDLKARMATRRRLPRSGSSTASTAHPQNIIAQPQQLVLTYSEFLGNFDTVPVSFNGDYRHRPSFSEVPYGESYDALGLDPSRVHSGFYPPTKPLQDYIIESGWTKDVFGRDQWVGHGRIEEVDDGSNCQHSAATPRVKAKSTAFASSSKAVGDDYDENGFYEDEIPLNSTPPPGPRPKKLPSLRATTTASDFHSLKAPSTVTLPMATPTHASSSSPVLDYETEVSLVNENLDLLASSQEDVKYMSTFFLARNVRHEFSNHIDLCSRMEESLVSLRQSLDFRMQIGAEEWNVRSASWYQKYSRRLLSLQTTLQRLDRLRTLLESHSSSPLRPRQQNAILTKLEQHEAKLADLASKYTTAFDRLRLRHLHFLLTQSHDEAKLQKEQKSARLMSHASFERRWKEGKTLRETLRDNFHEIRQEFYGNGQRRRHPAAP